MKNIWIAIAFSAMPMITKAQENTYKTTFSNVAENKIIINAAPEKVTIIGHNKNEILIRADKMAGDSEVEIEDSPENRKESNQRAEGLKPLTSSGADNTGIGLAIDKTEKEFIVKDLSKQASDGSFTFWLPDKTQVIIHEIRPMSPAQYGIQGLKGELDIQTLNSEFLIRDVSGPVVVKSTNGNIEIIYSRDMIADKPNSITTVNGYVDITLPASAKANLEINAINGEAFSDFDIKNSEESPEKSSSIPASVRNKLHIFNLKGEINGGGVPFKISAINGDVYIRKAK